jgi:hypothetical protein
VRGEKPVTMPTHPTLTDLELNPELRGARLATGRPTTQRPCNIMNNLCDLNRTNNLGLSEMQCAISVSLNTTNLLFIVLYMYNV